LAIVWLLSMSDLFFTLWAHTFTAFDEMNPLAAALLDQGLFGMLVVLKIGLTFLGATIFWRLRAHWRAEAAMWACVVMYVLLAIRWSSYTLGVMALAGAAA
jgi:hypothetical protein